MAQRPVFRGVCVLIALVGGVVFTAWLFADRSSVANPTVSAGLVDWHRDFSTAIAASKQSGKPVLLFTLLGNLDETYT